MKRPQWATIVGILGIVFGCFGILGGGQEVLVPRMLKMQKDVFSEVTKDVRKHQPDTGPTDRSAREDTRNAKKNVPPEIFKSFQSMFEFPPWLQTWFILLGVTKALISALYLFAAIWLLLLKPSSVRLFYWAAGASIVLGALHGAVAVSAGSFIVMAMALGGIFGILIDIVLIIVVVKGDKSAYHLALDEKCEVLSQTAPADRR